MFNRSIKHHLDFLTVKKQKLSPERPRFSRTENEGWWVFHSFRYLKMWGEVLGS